MRKILYTFLATVVICCCSAFNIASGATFLVTNNNDAGAGSLRQAVLDANANAGADAIDATGVTGTITLATGELLVTGDATISGPGANLLSVSGNNVGRVFQIINGSTVSINNITITRADATSLSPAWGGGILVIGSILNLDNAVVSDNAALVGAGVYIVPDGVFPASATITNSTISNNTASSGGGIFAGSDGTSCATLTVTNSTISGNTAPGGGGIMLYCPGFGLSTFTNCTITGNSASISGGGIYNQANLTLINTIVANSTSGGDIVNVGGTTDARYSLIEDGLAGVNGTSINNLTGDPLLGALTLNGGSTPTHALLVGSPAIDKGSSVVGLSTDQRGSTRPVDGPAILNAPGGDGSDIGAFEDICAGFTNNRAYVNASASGANNGTSWPDAFTTLQSALAITGTCGITEIWVAAGTYKPDEGTGQVNNDRNSSFALKSGVAIYGGFDGTETLLSGRDFRTNITILSGDIDGDNTLANNAFHVTVGSGTINTAVLDGFTITAGNADCIGTCALGGQWGGGMFNQTGSPKVSNCIFTGNEGDQFGGGMANYQSSNPLVTNCIFSANFNSQSQPSAGGGMYNFQSSPTIVNCVFSGNLAGTTGGGMYNSNSSSAVLTNCTFSGNRAVNNAGGGMANSTSIPTITNCIFWNNRDPSGASTATSSINALGSTTNFSVVQGEAPAGTGNLNGNLPASNPLFVTALDPNTAPSALGDFHLQSGSPCINTGTNSGAPSDDLDGNTRALTIGDPADMGAYEFASAAAITTSGTLTPFTTCAGTASDEQTFTVAGTGLTANLDVTAPAGFEVSLTSGSGFAASVSLTPASGTVGTTTIYVRLAASASGSPSGDISSSSTGATTQSVAASGTVNPSPNVDQPDNQEVCNNSSTTSVSFTGSVTGTIFNWTNNDPSIGLAASGTGDIASFIATNATNTPVIATITVTPTIGAPSSPVTDSIKYSGAMQTWTVPAGVTSIHVDAYAAQGGKNNAFAAVGGKGGQVTADVTVVPGTVLNIFVGGTSANAVGGFNGGGNGTLNAGGGGGATDIRVGGTALTNRILVAGGGGAGGQDNSFTNTAGHGAGGGLTGEDGTNPGAPLYARGGTQSAGGAGGRYANGTCAPGILCQNGSLGFGGNGETGTGQCSGTGGTGGGGGYYGGGGMEVNTAGGGSNFTDPALVTNVSHTQGFQTGNGLLTITYTPVTACTGPSKTFTITVNPTPNAVATPLSQTTCSGAAITTIALTGSVSGTDYNWTRDNNATVPGISASGVGDISGTLTNITSAAVTITFTITPTANGCTGSPVTASVLVNPTPDVDQPNSQEVCNNSSTTSVSFTGSVPGTIFNWTNNDPSIGLPASGTGNIASFTASNLGSAPATATITVTPSYPYSMTDNFDAYTVGANICSQNTSWTPWPGQPCGTVVNSPSFSATNSLMIAGPANYGPTTNDNVVSFNNQTTGKWEITFKMFVPPGRTGSFITEHILPGVDEGHYTQFKSDGTGNLLRDNVNVAFVYPQNQWFDVKQFLDLDADQTTLFINGVGVSSWQFSKKPQGTAGVKQLGGIDFFSQTTGLIVPDPNPAALGEFYLDNLALTPIPDCKGPSKTFTITVNPTPNAVATPASQTKCSGESITNIALTGNVSGTVYNWTRDNNASATGIAASGAGDITGTLTNTTNAPVTVTFTITPTANNCPGTPIFATVVVNPLPVVTVPANQEFCSGENLPTGTFNFTSNTGAGGNAAKILIAYADVSGPPATLRSALLSLPGVTNVDYFDAFLATPGLALLQQYDLVVTFSNNAYSDKNLMGDRLADYLDGGGTVVAFNFAWFGAPFDLTGRWLTGGYSPFNDNAPTQFINGSLGTFTAGHPLMQAVSSLNAFFRHKVTLTPGATQVAAWNDGYPLIAYKGHAVAVNAYVGDNPNNYSGDFAQVIVNAGSWLNLNTTFNWSNNNTSIGLAASGTGNSLPTFTANNNTASPVTATITVTATFSGNGVTCSGSNTFTITVKPGADAHAGPDQALDCHNVTAVLGTASVPGFSYNWATSGNGHFVSAQNIAQPTVDSPGVYTLIVVNLATGCISKDTAEVTITPPAPCKVCSGTTITANSNVTINFNTATPTYTGPAALQPFFSYYKVGTVKNMWKAIFNMGTNKLLVKNGVTITTTQVNGFAPGIEINGTCDMEVENGAHIVVNSNNQDAGNILLHFNGNVLVNGEIRNEVSGTTGLPGSITVASDCNDINVGQTGLIQDLGIDGGGNTISLLACGTDCNFYGSGNITVSGLVKSFAHAHAGNLTLNRPNIRVVSFNGSVTVNANTVEPLYDEYSSNGALYDIYGGLLSWVRDNANPGKVEVQARKNITVNGHGSDPTGAVHHSFGAIAAIATASSSPGGLVDVRSIDGMITASNRAFDVSGANLLATNFARINLYSKFNILLTRPGANNNFNPVVDATSPTAGDKGGKNDLRSYSGGINIGANVLVSAATPAGSGSVQGVNLLQSCTGVVNNGTVTPADLVPGNNSGSCSPVAPAKIYEDCAAVLSACNITMDITFTNVSCYGTNTGTITVTGMAGTAPYSYKLGAVTNTTGIFTGLSAGNYSITVTDAKGCTTTATQTITQPIKALGANSSHTNVNCKGATTGTMTAFGSGGTAPYSFKLGAVTNNTGLFTGLGAGTYMVTVTDAKNCTTTTSQTITQPSTALSVTTSQTDVTTYGGNNGSAKAIPAGGTSPYTYSWNTAPVQTTATATGLSAGPYQVTVTDSKGCTKTASVTIAQPLFACNQFRTETQAGWDVAASGTNAGTYLANKFTASFPSGLVIGGGCVGSKTLTLSTVAAVHNFLPNASGTPAALTANLSNPTNISYVNPLAGELVALTLNVKFDQADPAFAPSSSVTLGNLIYNQSPLAGLTVQQVLVEANKKLGGCSSVYTAAQLRTATQLINESWAGGVQGNSVLTCPAPFARPMVAVKSPLPETVSEGFTVYPNPTSGKAKVRFTTEGPGKYSLLVNDMTGRIIMKHDLVATKGTNTQAIDISHVARGVYMIILEKVSMDERKTRWKTKIVVE